MYVAENCIVDIVADRENVSLQNLTRCLDLWFAKKCMPHMLVFQFFSLFCGGLVFCISKYVKV